MNVADIQIFSRLAQTASFTKAAKQLGLTRSAVSKSVSRLEARLGVVLVNRSTRSASLTDAGRRLYKHAAEIDVALEHAIESVNGRDQDVVGNLAVSVSTSLGAALLPAIIRKFRVACPRLTFSLHFDERYVDLVGAGIDVAIRLASRLDDSSLLSRKLGTTRVVLAASPGYLDTFGSPQHVSELKSHRCLDLGSAARSSVVWRFQDSGGAIEVPIKCAITANSELALILAACLDEGILNIPELLIGGELANGRLQEILPKFSDPREWGLYAVYHHRNPPAKVRAFIDFVALELAALHTVDRWAPFSLQQSQSLLL